MKIHKKLKNIIKRRSKRINFIYDPSVAKYDGEIGG